MKKVFLLFSLCWGLIASAQVMPGSVLALANSSGNKLQRYVTVPEGVWFYNDFTVESWVYLYSREPWSRLFDFSNGIDQDNVFFAVSGKMDYPTLGCYGGTNLTLVDIPKEIPLKKWTHIAITVKDSTAIVYFDGVEVLNQKLPYLPSNVVRKQNYIGKSPWDNPALGDMLVDEFRIFNKARTVDEIRTDIGQHLNNSLGLVLYYDFDTVATPGVITDKSVTAANGTYSASDEHIVLLPASYTKKATSETGFDLQWNTQPNTEYKVLYSLDKSLYPAASSGLLSTGAFSARNLPEGTKYFQIGVPDIYNENTLIPLGVDSIVQKTTFPGNAYRCNKDNELKISVQDNIRSVMFWAKISSQNYIDGDSLFQLSNVVGSKVFSSVYCNGKQMKWAGISSKYFPKDQWFAVYAEFNALFNGDITFSNKEGVTLIDQLALIPSTLSTTQIESLTHSTAMYANALATYNFDSPVDLVDKTPIAISGEKAINYFAQSKAVITPFMQQITQLSQTQMSASCDKVEAAVKYEFLTATNSAFENAISKTETTNSLSFDKPDGDTVFVRVRSITATDTSEWSTMKYLLISPFPGHALALDGAGSYVTMPTNNWLGGSFTVECWVFLPNYNHSWARLFEFGNGLGSNNILFALTDGQFKNQAFSIRRNGDVLWEPQIPVNIPVREWTHVAITLDSTGNNTGTLKIYYNGKIVLNTVCPNLPNQITRTINYIGNSSWANEPTEAKIDEFRMYDYAIPQDSIIARMHKPLQGNEKGLKLYYSFDDRNTLPLLTDLSNNAQTGTFSSLAAVVGSDAALVPIIRKIDTLSQQKKLQIAWDKIPVAKHYELQLPTGEIEEVIDTVAFVPYGTLYTNRFQVRTIANNIFSGWSSGVFVDENIERPNNAYCGVATSFATNGALELAASDSLTVMAWVKGFSPSGSYIIRQRNEGVATGTVGRAMYVRDNQLVVGYNSYGNGWQDFTCPMVMDSSQWNHVAYSVADGGVMRLYVNGVRCKNVYNYIGNTQQEADSLLSPVHAVATKSSDPFVVKYRTSANFLIDNLQLYNATLSESEIRELSHQSPSKTKKLIAGFDFNQESGTSVADIVGNTSMSVLDAASTWKKSNAQYSTFIRTVHSVSDSTIGFAWDTIPGVTEYEVQYSANENFASPKQVTVTRSSVVLENLQAATMYYARVRAHISAITQGQWSAIKQQATTSLYDSLVAYYPIYGDKFASYFPPTAALFPYDSVKAASNRFAAPRQAIHLGTKDKAGMLATDIENTSANNLASEFTCALWFNADSVKNGTLLSKADFTNNLGYAINLLADSTIGVVSMNGTFKQYSTSAKYKPHQWNFLVVSRNADGMLSLLLNDASAMTPVKCDVPAKNTELFRMGDALSDPDVFRFIGSIDDVRLYTRALSKNECSRLYHEGGWPYISITLSNKTVTAQKDAGQTVGALSTLVANGLVPNPQYSYQLVGGVGSSDNSKFTIAGNVLKTATILDAQQQTNAFVRIKCTNLIDNQSIESAMEITIKDSVLNAVYDFEKLTAGPLDNQNGWQTVPHFLNPEGQVFVGVTDKSNTISPSIESFYAQTRNSIDSLFTDLRIHNDLHAQYSLSFDAASTGMGTRFSVLSGYDRNLKANNEILTLVLSFGATADSVVFAGRPLATVNQIPNTAKVQVILSDLDRTTAHITVRAQALNQPDASWLPIVVNASVDLDTAKAGVANPANWNGVFCGLEPGGWLDNIAIEKRPMNAHRNTMNADLLVHYSMDRTDSLIDVSQNKLDASLFSNAGNEQTYPYSDRFKVGESISFNAQASYCTDAISAETNFDEICISAWASVYNVDGAQQQSIVMLGLDTAINAYVDNQTIHFVFGGKHISIDYPSDVNRAAWNHFVFVSSKKENSTAIYLNGRLLLSVGVVGTISKSDKRSLCIGRGFNGAIDDIRIFGRLLNQSEITALYTEGGWPVQRITLTDRVYLQANQTAQLPVSVYPANAPTDKLIYSVANPAIATISNTGLITAGDGSGVTTVNVSTINGSVTATAVVEVVTSTISPITKIVIVGNKSEMLLNGSVNNKLSYTFTPKKALTTDITWASSNESVASIAADGMITAKAPGTSYIYLYANKDKTVKDSFLLTVRPSAVPLAGNDTVLYRVRAVSSSTQIADKDTAVISVAQFFSDDSELSFAVEPLSNYKDSIQLQFVNGEIKVYQLDTLVQKEIKYITITATDVDNQKASKCIAIQMSEVADVAPKLVSKPQFDAFYQFRKLQSINLRGIIADDYTPFERLKFDTIVASNNDTAWIKNGVLTLNVRPQKTDLELNGNMSFYVFDAKKHATQVSIPYSFKRVTNKAPNVVVDESLTQTADTTFEIDLSKSQTTDDYTPLAKLLWSVDKASNVNVVLNGTILQLSASSSAWSGSEKIYVRATDEAGAIGVDSIVFVQKVNVSLDGVPQVDFDVKLEDGSNVPAIVAKGTKLKATMIDKSNKTIAVTDYKWVLSGAKKLSYNGSADFSFECDSLGKISVKLIAANGSGETTVRHSNIATVVGLSASSDKVCSDSSVVLSINDSTAGTSIVWTDMTETSAAVKVTPSKTTTYKVTVTKAGAKVEDLVTVSVLETPKVFAKDTAICANLSVELSNAAFSKVIWNNATTTAQYIAKPGETITVQAWVDQSCPVLKDTIVVASKDVPVTELPAKLSLCDGVKDTLVAKGGISYAWSKDNVTNDSLVVDGAGRFYVTVTAANDCKTIDSVEVSVGSSPEVKATASKTTVCEKGIVKLWVDNADAALTYQWNTTVLADSSTTANVVGDNDFYVTATNQAGCQQWDSVRVVVTVAAPLSIAVLPNDSVCVGTQVSLTASGATSYKWSDDLGSSTAATAKPSATKTFTVTATKDQCEQRDTVRIVVHQLPTVTATPSKASVCRGAMVSLNGDGAKSYAWDNSVLDATPFKLAQTTTFTVTGTDANGCKNTAQTTVKLSLPYREQLGLVTYDSATGKKLIVAWSPTKSQGIASYVLYRFNDEKAKFDSLKRFTPSDSSYYFDSNVDPLAQSYTYKLATRDSACNDTAESRAHTSVRLTASLSTDVKPKANLSWNLYGGMAVEKYHVLVYDASNKLIETIDRAKGPNDLVSLDYSYDKHQTGNKYRIAFDLPSQVVVSKLKSDTGPFSQSLSNMSEASLVDMPEITVNEIVARPNPVSDVLVIRSQSLDIVSSVTMVDSKGISFSVPVLSSSLQEISLSVHGLSDGIYTLVLISAQKSSTVTIQVMK